MFVASAVREESAVKDGSREHLSEGEGESKLGDRFIAAAMERGNDEGGIRVFY